MQHCPTVPSEVTPSIVVWTSPDGHTWTPTTRTGDVFQAHATASTVGIAEGDFVIVGANLSGTGSATDPIRPTPATWYATS